MDSSYFHNREKIKKRRVVKKPTTDQDKVLSFKEGDTIYTTKYGACVIDFIDKKNLNNMPGVSVKDEQGKVHFVHAKDIIVED